MGHWRYSSSYFREMEDHHLKDGSVPRTHPLLQKIKADHLKLERLYGERNIEEVNTFYKVRIQHTHVIRQS